jgi:hypothetical protein
MKFFTIGKKKTDLSSSPAISRYCAIALFAAVVAGIIEILVF